MSTVRDRLFTVALAKGLRETTITSYLRFFNQMGISDLEDPSLEVITEALWTLDNPNTRRSATIAVRSVLGHQIKIPKGIPRRYELPDEDTLRLALMTSPHETRGLLMMYGGLRIGEACATQSSDVRGDRLTVARQVVEVFKTGQPTVRRIGPVKTSADSVVIPHWLSPRISTLGDPVSPMSVRESLRRAGVKVGIRLNPHLLRHWHATELINRGVPLALVSQQMRHSDISITLATYQQYSDDDIHKAFG